uniref:Uncharacterized protein n=1 Tax=Solanum tuberosum TaxID=4113 RepID=M0ZVU4_SOLTU
MQFPMNWKKKTLKIEKKWAWFSVIYSHKFARRSFSFGTFVSSQKLFLREPEKRER